MGKKLQSAKTSGGEDKPTETATEPPLPSKPAYVVGIGASAGGLEALERLFDAMPADTGMAMVVVQHLSPDHKSLMAELLSRHTGMSVLQAVEGTALAPNTVYLIPPKMTLTVQGGILRLADKADRPLPTFPIDIFLNSLAEDFGEKAIAVILSGTGSDGTRGIRAIKEEGGMIMVQDPASSKFDGMPRNAIATGLADYVLAPEQMPDELIKYVSHPLVRGEREALAAQPGEESRLARIFTLLKSHSGVDFALYKQTTVLRRIERRLSITQIETLDAYVKYLFVNPDEVDLLIKDLLIGVTRFFRDPDSFDLLKRRVIPELFKARPGPIRAWACGCSTGEEAYSLAILFREYMEETGDQREVKIFATDIDKDSLEFASNGMYPENIVADLTPERFRNNFIKYGDKYRVNKSVREMVIFALQNIVKDPPFNKIDLLSCRNMLIYLQPVLQQKALAFFNFALNEGGFLFLGSSETVGAYTNLFSPFDTKWKIYRCRGKHLPLPSEGFSIATVRRKTTSRLARSASGPVESVADRSIGEVLEGLMDRFVPPTLIISQDSEVVHVRGDVSRFVGLRAGKTSLNVANLVHKDLSIALETGINKALRGNQPASYRDIVLRDAGQTLRVDLEVLPFVDDRSGEKLVAAVFQEVHACPDAPRGGEPFDLDDKSRQRIQDLENELQYNRENLQATIEEVETTNEELQATNEELLSANEELQSTNEELQSVNEELITVNAEYQSKIAELTELNNDMSNLLSATDIGVIFLDRDLMVRRFTPAIREEINLMDFDIGRPIAHISLNVDYPSLVDDARAVLDNLAPIQREVGSRSGKTLLMRMRPYVTLDNVVKGVVVTFVDVTGVKQAEAVVRKLSKAVEASPALVLLADPLGRIEYANHNMKEHTGYALEDLEDKTLDELVEGREARADLRRALKLVASGKSWSGRLVCLRKTGETYIEQASLVPVTGSGGAVENILKLSEDITPRVSVEKELADLREHLEELVRLRTAEVARACASLDERDEVIVVLEADHTVGFLNAVGSRLLGVDKDRARGLDWFETFVPEEERAARRERFQVRMRGGPEAREGFRSTILRKSGEAAAFNWASKPLYDDTGRITGIMLIGSQAQE